jgi:hypothetical protein
VLLIVLRDVFVKMFKASTILKFSITDQTFARQLCNVGLLMYYINFK